MRTTATIQELEQALKTVNKKHGYKLEFNRIEQATSKRVIFTLKSPSKIKGARRFSNWFNDATDEHERNVNR